MFGAGEVVAEKIRTDVFKVFRIRRSMGASICTHLCILYFVLQEAVQQPLQNTLIFKTQGWHHLKTGFVPINGLNIVLWSQIRGCDGHCQQVYYHPQMKFGTRLCSYTCL